MAYPTGAIPVTGFIGTYASSDTYATHVDILGWGGLMSVSTLTDRNNIPVDRRKFGMFVTVYGDGTAANNKTYRLCNTVLGGTNNTITDNNNWVEFQGSGGGGGGAVLNQKTVPDPTYTPTDADDNYIIYFTHVDGTLITMDDAVSANVTFTAVKAPGAGNLEFESDGTSVLNTANGDLILYVTNGAVTWIKRNSTDYYGWGAFGEASDLSFSGGLLETAGTVTLAPIAGNTILGNNSGSSAIPAALTATQVTAMLNNFSTTLKGLVPPPTTVTGKFLKDDGTWSVAAAPLTDGSGTTANGTSVDLGGTLAVGDTIIASDSAAAQLFYEGSNSGTLYTRMRLAPTIIQLSVMDDVDLAGNTGYFISMSSGAEQEGKFVGVNDAEGYEIGVILDYETGAAALSGNGGAANFSIGGNGATGEVAISGEQIALVATGGNILIPGLQEELDPETAGLYSLYYSTTFGGLMYGPIPSGGTAFTLTNGSGTTANGTAVDIGGTITGSPVLALGTANFNSFSISGNNSSSLDIYNSSDTTDGINFQFRTKDASGSGYTRQSGLEISPTYADFYTDKNDTNELFGFQSVTGGDSALDGARMYFNGASLSVKRSSMAVYATGPYSYANIVDATSNSSVITGLTLRSDRLGNSSARPVSGAGVRLAFQISSAETPTFSYTDADMGIKHIWSTVTLGAEETKYVFETTHAGATTDVMELGYGLLKVPNLTAATTANVLYYDSATGTITYGGGGGGSTSRVRPITLLSPNNSENITMFKTEVAITVTEVADVVRGSSTPSATWNIKYAATRDSGSPTSIFTSDRTTTSTSGASTTTINNASIPAGSWIWITTSAVSGTVNELHVTLNYDE